MKTTYEDVAAMLTSNQAIDRGIIERYADLDSTILAAGLLHGCLLTNKQDGPFVLSHRLPIVLQRLAELRPTSHEEITRQALQEFLVMLPPTSLREAMDVFGDPIPPAFLWKFLPKA